MSDPFLAEIKIFAGNFAPRGWALCNGQLLSIAQNTALFSLLGTYYGGDGRVTFALPNFQSVVPIGEGNGAGLTPRVLGEIGGAETETLLTSNIPAHTHTLNATAGNGRANAVSGNTIAHSPVNVYADSNTANAVMNPSSLSMAGNTQPHNNMQPYLVLNFIIATEGIFPPRG